MHHHFRSRALAPALVSAVVACVSVLAPSALGQVNYTVKKLGVARFPDAADMYNAFWRVEFGQLTVDSLADAAVLLARPTLDAAKVFNQWGPGSYDATLPVSLGGSPPIVHDVAIVPDGVSSTPGNKGQDLTVYSTSNGLKAVYYNLDAGAYEAVDFLGTLGDVTRLAYGTFTGAIQPDLIGYLPATQDLCIIPDVRMNFSGGVSVDYGTVQYISLGSTLYDLEVLNYASGVQDEIAVATSTGVRVLDATGMVLEFEATYFRPSTQLADLRYGTLFPEERLVVVWEKANGTFSIVEWRNTGSSSIPVDLGWTGIVGIDAGEHDADAIPEYDYPDVVFSLTSTLHKKIILNDFSSTKPFKLANATNIQLEPVSPGTDPMNRAEPKFCDVDYDGDEDVVIGWRNPATGMGALYLVRAGARKASQQVPQLSTKPFGTPPYYGDCFYDGWDSDGSNNTYDYTNVAKPLGIYPQGTVTLYLAKPTVWPLNIPPVDDNNNGDDTVKVEYYIWELDDALSGADASNYARGLAQIDKGNLPDSNPDTTPWDNTDDQIWSLARFAIDDHLELDVRDLYGIEARLVEVSPPGSLHIVDRGPTYLRVISFDADETSDMVTELGLSFSSDVFSMEFTDYFAGGESYAGNFQIDVIEVGCLGIKNGGPTNPFAN